MHLLRAPGRLAVLVATLALMAIGAPIAAVAQESAAPCTESPCGEGTAESPYVIIQQITNTVALPLLTLQGTVNGRGTVSVSRLSIRAKRGTSVDVTCFGKHCPFKRLRTVVLTTKLNLHRLETKLRPSMLLRFRLQYGKDSLGKYVSYRVRRNNTPKRLDSCIDPDSGKVRGCFVG